VWSWIANSSSEPSDRAAAEAHSRDKLYGLSVLVAWARAARVVRVMKGRLVRVNSAAKSGHGLRPVEAGPARAVGCCVSEADSPLPRQWLLVRFVVTWKQATSY
jgi:hypothetical protein